MRWRGALLLAALCLSCAAIGIRERSGDSWYRDSRRVVLDGGEVSSITLNMLRRRGLAEAHRQQPLAAIEELREEMRETKARDLAVAIAELAFLENRRTAKADVLALGSALRYAYAYLFDTRLQPAVRPYDAQFRFACDLYAAALADLLRQSGPEAHRDPASRRLRWYGGEAPIEIVERDLHWDFKDIDALRIAYDVRVSGLPTPDSRRGLGVPCVLRRTVRAADRRDLGSRYLPAELEVAATVVVRFPDGASVLDPAPSPALLEIVDPADRTEVVIEGAPVPLEFDVTTPVAAFLAGKRQSYGVRGLLNAASQDRHGGLHTFQPLRQDRIPVLFIHGLASDPLTWLPLYNDLMANDTIRTRCQFLFWFYPTGQPILYSAYELRSALKDLHDRLDPDDTHPAVDELVVCGHSMGGLLARTLATDTGYRIWDTAFTKRPEELDVAPEDVALMRDCLVFDSLPFVRRAIFYAAPHRGSPKARGNLADWANGLASMPKDVGKRMDRVLRLPEWKLRRTRRSSIVALAPDNPVLLTLADLPVRERTTYHSILGADDPFAPYDSAHLDGAASELVLPTGHSVQRDPRAARETRRILLEHIAAFDAGTRK